MMKIILFTLTVALAGMMMACGGSTANNATANKPANVANTAPSPAVDQEAVKAEVRKVMEAVKAGLSKNDADAMDKVYADDYKITYPDGTSMNKAERLAAIRSGAIKYTSFDFTEESITVNPDGNGATGVFKITAKGTMKGKPMDPETRTTGVFTKTKDGWRLMSASNVKIEAAAAKPGDQAKANSNMTGAAPKTAANAKKIDAAAADDGGGPPPPKKK